MPAYFLLCWGTLECYFLQPNSRGDEGMKYAWRTVSSYALHKKLRKYLNKIVLNFWNKMGGGYWRICIQYGASSGNYWELWKLLKRQKANAQNDIGGMTMLTTFRKINWHFILVKWSAQPVFGMGKYVNKCKNLFSSVLGNISCLDIGNSKI